MKLSGELVFACLFAASLAFGWWLGGHSLIGWK